MHFVEYYIPKMLHMYNKSYLIREWIKNKEEMIAPTF